MALLHYLHSVHLIEHKKHVVNILTEIEKTKMGKKVVCAEFYIFKYHTVKQKFSKDPQRREKWLKNLILKPSKEVDVS